MGTLNAPEIREFSSGLSPLELAKRHDSYVRDFERRWSDWTDIARICLTVDRDKEWELLGFHSWEHWLMDAAPKSRSYIYLVVGRYKELSADIPEDELANIPLGSAGVLKALPRSLRKDPGVRKAAKSKPKQFREALKQDHPEQLLEAIEPMRIHFTSSQRLVFEETLEEYRAREGDEYASEADMVEDLCQRYRETQ